MLVTLIKQRQIKDLVKYQLRTRYLVMMTKGANTTEEVFAKTLMIQINTVTRLVIHHYLKIPSKYLRKFLEVNLVNR